MDNYSFQRKSIFQFKNKFLKIFYLRLLKLLKNLSITQLSFPINRIQLNPSESTLELFGEKG